MFTLLSLINNLSIPCSSLFYLNNTQSDTSLITVSPLKEYIHTELCVEEKQKNQNKIIQKYSLIYTEWIMRWHNHKQPNGIRVGRLLIDENFWVVLFHTNIKARRHYGTHFVNGGVCEWCTFISKMLTDLRELLQRLVLSYATRRRTLPTAMFPQQLSSWHALQWRPNSNHNCILI